LLQALEYLDRDYLDLRADAALFAQITPQPRKLMYRLKRKGLAASIQNGRYVVYLDGRPRPASRPRVRSLEPLAVAALRRLEHDYFLSWHSALWHHRLVEQQSRRLYVAVAGARKRDAAFGSFSIRFLTVAPERFFGGMTVCIDGQDVRVATVERAIIDAFDRPGLAGDLASAPIALRAAHSRGKLDSDRLVELALRFERPSLNRRLGFFMERYDISGAGPLLTRLGKGYAVTLAAGVRPEDEAGVDTRWGVRLDGTLLAAADRPK
jgi:predicted transcriptional regulator of viral defense system